MALTHNTQGSVIFENGKAGTAVAVLDASGSPSGTALTLTHTTATATTGSGAMLAANTSRRYALIQNVGSTPVFLKVGAAAVASQGIMLAANGGAYEMSAAFGNLATGAVNGITSTGSAVVTVTEGV